MLAGKIFPYKICSIWMSHHHFHFMARMHIMIYIFSITYHPNLILCLIHWLWYNPWCSTEKFEKKSAHYFLIKKYFIRSQQAITNFRDHLFTMVSFICHLNRYDTYYNTQTTIHNPLLSRRNLSSAKMFCLYCSQVWTV